MILIVLVQTYYFNFLKKVIAAFMGYKKFNPRRRILLQAKAEYEKSCCLNSIKSFRAD
jgi:hypothetical protein